MWTVLSVSKCGWAFASDTRPCVAQRVCPMPTVATRAATATPPSPSSRAATASRSALRLPTARTESTRPSQITEIPALS